MSVFVFVVTPYNHRTYYNELLKSGRQVKDSFYAYVGEGGASNSDDLKVAGLVPRLFLATSDDSSFCLLWGKFCFSWVLHSKSSMWCSSSLVESKIFCRCLHLGWIPGDRCCAPLDPFCVSSLVDSTLLLGCWDHSFVPQTHLIEVSGSRRTELTRSCQGPPLKSEWQKVGSNSGPTAPEARTLPLLHAPLLNRLTMDRWKMT